MEFVIQMDHHWAEKQSHLDTDLDYFFMLLNQARKATAAPPSIFQFVR